MNLRIITKNHEADPGIGFLTKSTLKSYDHATAMPPAWVLKNARITQWLKNCQVLKVDIIFLN